MESDEIRARLRETERAEAAPYIDQRRSPWWFVPGFALWFGAMAAVQAHQWREGTDSMTSALLTLAIVLVLAMMIGGYLSWHQRYHGAMPRTFGPKPPEISRVYRVYAVTFALGAVAVIGVALLVPWWATGLITVAVVFVWMSLYERLYERAAQAARERLA